MVFRGIGEYQGVGKEGNTSKDLHNFPISSLTHRREIPRLCRTGLTQKFPFLLKFNPGNPS